MTDNVIHLPRPIQLRTGQEPLAFFVRIGRNDHKELLELIAAGERGIFGLVIDAANVERHRELITEARKRDFDVILDPKTQQMGLPGTYSAALAELPWGESKSHHSIAEFDGVNGEKRAAQMVEFALKNDFTQVLGPSHLIGDPNDPWLRRDISAMTFAADRIQKNGGHLGLIYSLAFPMAVLRDDARRSAIVAATDNIPRDSTWLKIENFGDDASGEKAAAYIKACKDFHARGIPLVADHVGGLPGLGALAFNAVGGIAHGVTVNQNFKTSSWRNPPQKKKKGGGGWRVYLPQLDMLVKPEVAEKFIESSQRVRGRHVCKDTHCCPRDLRDMLDRPARHALYQRAREIEKLSEVPESLRVSAYLENVRRVSDDVALAASFDKVDEKFRKRLQEKQKDLGHFRDAMAHLSTMSSDVAGAIAPSRRSTKKPGNQ
jgi:hypothetical protein